MANKEKIQIEVEIPSESIKLIQVSCPNGHSLSDENIKFHGFPSIKIKVHQKKDEGFLYLDPVYGSYHKIEEGIKIPNNAVCEFFCPECNINLTDPHDTCQLCSSPLFVFHLPKGSIVEGCLKKGCLFHKMKIVDAEQQFQRLYKNGSIDSYL